MTQTEAEKLRINLISRAERMGCGDKAEDYAHDLILQYLEGKSRHQYSGHGLIDCIRRDTKTGSRRDKHVLKEMKTQYRIHERIFRKYPDPFEEFILWRDLAPYLKRLTVIEQEIFYLKIALSYSFYEIGNVLRKSIRSESSYMWARMRWKRIIENKLFDLDRSFYSGDTLEE